MCHNLRNKPIGDTFIVHKTILFPLLPLIAVLFFIVSCSPAAQSEDAPPAAPSEIDVEDMIFQDEDAAQEESAPASENSTESAESAEQNQSLEIGEPSTATHYGVPVGFTAEGRPYRGNLDAPILIEEFSDYQCPFCGRFNEQTMPQLTDNQIAAGEVLLVYYDFPLESIHPQAVAAANAARCAGEQGADLYWQMHDLLYENMGQWGVSNPDSIFASYAAQLPLDVDQFEQCQSEMRYNEEIQNDIAHAISRGVRSTPSFFLNDQPLVGAQPLEAFNQAIAMISGGETIAEEPPPQESPLQPPAVKPTPVAIDMETYAATMGDPAAPVTIVEFTDYQCPFCQSFSADTLPALMADKIATGEVYYILKDMPLDNIHPSARSAAKAARCAGSQGFYWEMHDALFESQNSWGGQSGLPSEVFFALAGDLDLDLDAFSACMDDLDVSQAIQANIDEAQALGATSTPFFFIDGYPIPGAQPYELFDFAIAEAAAGTLADAYVPPEPNLEDAFAIGDPAAPVTIVEFTDYQCPFCSRHFEQSFTQIKENYIDSGQVYYIFKDFPLTNIHPQAVKAAEAVRCAAEQDAFLPMHDRLYIDQAAWSGKADAPKIFKQFAQDMNLDAAAFGECLDSGRHEAAVMADLEEGAQLGITGTPAFLINGHSMSGAQPYPIFEQAIEQFLSEAG